MPNFVGNPAAPAKRLSWALTASVGAHFLVLLGFQQRVDYPRVAESPQFLRAELRRTTEMPVVTRPATLPMRRVEKSPESARQVPSTSPADLPGPQRTTVDTAVSAESSQRFASSRDDGDSADLRLSSAPSVAATATMADYDGDDLRRYRIEVARQAKRFKRYPLLARERGWEGTSEVALSLLPESSAPEVSLEKTSGFPLLDAQALEMIRRASLAAPVPQGLQRRAVNIVVPVVFDLAE